MLQLLVMYIRVLHMLHIPALFREGGHEVRVSCPFQVRKR